MRSSTLWMLLPISSVLLMYFNVELVGRNLIFRCFSLDCFRASKILRMRDWKQLFDASIEALMLWRLLFQRLWIVFGLQRFYRCVIGSSGLMHRSKPLCCGGCCSSGCGSSWFSIKLYHHATPGVDGSVIVGEIANFVAYAFAPAVLVTPLGALSIIVSAVLAHFILKERLHNLGILGCVMCIVGSVVIVIHAPKERAITSVQEIWSMATQMDFLLYVGSVIVLVFVLILHFAPRYGHMNVLIFTGICSLMGSLSVMSVKALGTSIKLTFEGNNQLVYPETWFFLLVVLTCVITQMNYLNKALDTFNTAIVSPIYYVMFTTLTILASVIMFKDWDGQGIGSIVSEICGFIVVLSGTILLHATKDFDRLDRSGSSKSIYGPLSPSLSTRLCSGNGEFLRHEDIESVENIDLRQQEL